MYTRAQAHTVLASQRASGSLCKEALTTEQTLERHRGEHFRRCSANVEQDAQSPFELEGSLDPNLPAASWHIPTCTETTLQESSIL